MSGLCLVPSCPHTNFFTTRRLSPLPWCEHAECRFALGRYKRVALEIETSMSHLELLAIAMPKSNGNGKNSSLGASPCSEQHPIDSPLSCEIVHVCSQSFTAQSCPVHPRPRHSLLWPAKRPEERLGGSALARVSSCGAFVAFAFI